MRPWKLRWTSFSLQRCSILGTLDPILEVAVQHIKGKCWCYVVEYVVDVRFMSHGLGSNLVPSVPPLMLLCGVFLFRLFCFAERSFKQMVFDHQVLGLDAPSTPSTASMTTSARLRPIGRAGLALGKLVQEMTVELSNAFGSLGKCLKTGGLSHGCKCGSK